jgi:hypothetical protein
MKPTNIPKPIEPKEKKTPGRKKKTIEPLKIEVLKEPVVLRFD